jgi:hypothetical protein
MTSQSKFKVVSEPYYRGAGLIGNSLAFTAILFLVDFIKGQPIEWLFNFMPLITVLVVLLFTSSSYVDRLEIRRDR